MPHEGATVEVGYDESPEGGHSSLLVEVSRKAIIAWDGKQDAVCGNPARDV